MDIFDCLYTCFLSVSIVESILDNTKKKNKLHCIILCQCFSKEDIEFLSSTIDSFHKMPKCQIDFLEARENTGDYLSVGGNMCVIVCLFLGEQKRKKLFI